MRIWKWTLAVQDFQSLQMPKNAQVLSVQMQGGQPQLWALVDESAPKETRRFETHGTGNPMPGPAPGAFAGTYQMQNEWGTLVFHVFEQA